MTSQHTPEAAASPDIAQATTQKRRGKKPSGIVKDNVCVRLTADAKSYLLMAGNGSTSRGVDALIAFHQKALQDAGAQQSPEAA